ncbi:uncharacterized protein LOC133521982 isoform X1 [Cydia pomonella]|uniref:uncharacterized protein LOC133521982 isoform X1 n=1 Tax=Cydia pomonella TaxID=82600 RepID=UPI002ADDB5AD|nr:uncharacterized protein LOC133521982 isoform X1 [Cydia pomonella]
MLIPTCLIKLTELLLTIACLVLHHYSYDLTDVSTLILCSGTYVGFIVVLSGEIVGEMIFAPLDLLQDMYFGIVGMIMFSVCGGLVLSARLKPSIVPRTGDPTAGTIAASLALLNALLMFLDLSMGYLDSEEFNEETSV